MSEEHRYRAINLLTEDGNCINYHSRGPEVVLATSFDRITAELRELLSVEQPEPFQLRVKPWMLECFGEAISKDRQERNHRFLEEALELVQSTGATADEAYQLVAYVYGRPVGEPSQEVGGVMVTLAALCLAAGLDMHTSGETELARIWTKVEQIRAKQAAKPAMSPLPGAYPNREKPDFDRVTAENSALQSQLTAADERADRLASLTNDDLIAIARTAALNSVDRYNYMPCIPEEAFAWKPHYWVIEAMRAALKPTEGGGDDA